MNYSDKELTKNKFLGNKLEILQFSEGYRGNMDSVLVAASVAAKSGQKVLELGCGKGEYSVSLAEKDPQKNFIGVDIKGARIWKGATDSLSKKLTNIAFLRVRIEWIEHCFDKNEIDEIWITFPDPQLKFRRSSKRLTHPNFLKKYNKILKKSGVVHLKTDNQFLHAYTMGILDGQSHSIEYSSNDIYNSEHLYEHLGIKTYYEQKYLEKGMPITYVKFRLNY